MSSEKFVAYPKTRRLEDETVTISEKVDGTNGVLFIHKPHLCDVLNGSTDAPYILAGCRSRWLKDDDTKSWDNHGFGKWVAENAQALHALPEGFHYGEWYGKGINHGYGMKERRFMLFNRKRYENLTYLPKCVELETIIEDDVPVAELSSVIDRIKNKATVNGSFHIPESGMVEGLIMRFKLSARVYKEVWNKS